MSYLLNFKKLANIVIAPYKRDRICNFKTSKHNKLAVHRSFATIDVNFVIRLKFFNHTLFNDFVIVIAELGTCFLLCNLVFRNYPVHFYLDEPDLLIATEPPHQRSF